MGRFNKYSDGVGARRRAEKKYLLGAESGFDGFGVAPGFVAYGRPRKVWTVTPTDPACVHVAIRALAPNETEF